MLKKLLGTAGLVGALWGVANGIFVATLFSLIPHCPAAIGDIIGSIVGLATLVVGTAWFSVIFGAGIAEFATGTVSRKGLIVALGVTLVSVVFTHALVGWVGPQALVWALYLQVVWNFVVFSIVAAIASGISIAAGFAAQAGSELLKDRPGKFRSF